ncbi:hypothetical protein [Streptomyces sp. NBC_00083]|uniref:hypothetical protein n=1 Tax=Streptomyces sp. NBC_00083 TaxID=2975647 RepID=UPI00224DF4EE|nr:hypothetical protein [Streptomyces sp. NBC_00083]MCX5386568.1 hypothetical protein [Streptomyces sp. NBC_00083]
MRTVRTRRRTVTVTAGLALATALSAGTALADEAASPQRMPGFVGKGLLQVYNTLDARTKLDVEDIGGEHRSVLWPFNWKVCRQSPAAGAPLTDHTRVSIGVLLKTETCR